MRILAVTVGVAVMTAAIWWIPFVLSLPQDRTPELMAHWVFDHPQDPVEDLSTNGWDGDPESIAYVLDRDKGLVAVFDGTDSLVTFDYIPQPCALTDGFTLGVILKPDLDHIPSPRNRMRVFCRRDGTTWGNMFDFQRQAGDNVYFRCVLRGDGKVHHANSIALTEERWYEFVVQWTSTDPPTAAVVYTDGSAEGGSDTGPPEFEFIDDSDATLLIGAADETLGPVHYYKGRLLELKLYNGLVDPEDVFSEKG